MSNDSKPVFGSLKLQDFLALGGLVVAVTLGVQAIRTDASDAVSNLKAAMTEQLTGLERRLDDIGRRMETQERRDAEWVRRVTLDLWIERARQAPSLRELPNLPSY